MTSFGSSRNGTSKPRGLHMELMWLRMPLLVFGYDLLLCLTFNVSLLWFHMIPSIFFSFIFVNISSILDFALSDCGKTSSKELEFDMHFVILIPPYDNDFVTLKTVSFAKSIFLYDSK